MTRCTYRPRRRWWSDDSGASPTDYGIAMGLAVLLGLAGWRQLETVLQDSFAVAAEQALGAEPRTGAGAGAGSSDGRARFKVTAEDRPPLR